MLDWPDQQVPCHRRGKLHTMVMMFVGGGGAWLLTQFQDYSYCTNPTEREFLFPPGVILGIFQTKSSNTSNFLAMFWHLSICISLFVRANRASTCMFNCQTNMYIQVDIQVECFFFKKKICTLRVCRMNLNQFCRLNTFRHQHFSIVLIPTQWYSLKQDLLTY